LLQAALQGGGEIGDSIPDIMGQAASFYGEGPLEFLEFSANAPELAGAIGTGLGSQMITSLAMKQLDGMGLTDPNGKVSQDALASMISQQTGFSIEASRSTVITALNEAERNPRQEAIMEAVRSRRDKMEQMKTGILGRTGAYIGEFFEEASTNTFVGNVATLVNDGFSDAAKDFGAYMRGDERLDGIYLTDQVKETYGEMLESGEFDSEKFSENISPEQARANMVEDGAARIEDLRNDWWDSSILNEGSYANPTQFTERDLSLIAAGSKSIEETKSRVGEAGELGIGGNVEQFLDLPGELDAELLQSTSGTRWSDIKGAKNVQEELDIISRRSFNKDFKDLTPEETAASITRHGEISDKSKQLNNFISQVNSFGSGSDSLSYAEFLEQKADGFEQEFEQGFADVINETNSELIDKYLGEDFDFERDVSIEDQARFKIAVRTNSLDEFEFSEEVRGGDQFIELFKGNLSDDLVKSYSKAKATRAERSRFLRVGKEAMLEGFDNPDDEKAFRSVYNEVTQNTLEKTGVIESGAKYDFSKESAANNFLERGLLKSGVSQEEIDELMAPLRNPESYADHTSGFHEVVSRIDDPDYAIKAAARFQNDTIRDNAMQGLEDDVLVRLGETIRGGAIRVIMDKENSKKGFDPQDGKPLGFYWPDPDN
jgi:hypothetical protein